MTLADRKSRARRRRALLAETVIAQRWPVKAAADLLGVNVKNAEWMIADLKRRIRVGTNKLLGTKA